MYRTGSNEERRREARSPNIVQPLLQKRSFSGKLVKTDHNTRCVVLLSISAMGATESGTLWNQSYEKHNGRALGIGRLPTAVLA